jgi:hypothetical protein
VRIRAVSTVEEGIDPAYAVGQREARRAAIDFALEVLTSGEEDGPCTPNSLPEQARRAARAGISLDAMLRRYILGYAAFNEFIIIEAARRTSKVSDLEPVLRGYSTAFDRLVTAVMEAYVSERTRLERTKSGQRLRRVEALLAGEEESSSEFDYDLSGAHLGLIASGETASSVIRKLAAKLGSRLLLVEETQGRVWGWLAPNQGFDLATIASRLSEAEGIGSVGLGAPADTICGWRLTHRQAQAAFLVAERSRRRIARYDEVSLLSSVLRDELLISSLRKLYLDRIDSSREEGRMLKRTLRAYFAAERNVSSAAISLKVKRHTVRNRIRVVEERVGRSLLDCSAELELALRIDELS